MVLIASIFVFRLYNAGVQMNLSNLYPKVSFPVPRGTQMINSMVKWDHSAEWTVPKIWYKEKKVFSVIYYFFHNF
jgi:hypothetical protein